MTKDERINLDYSVRWARHMAERQRLEAEYTALRGDPKAVTDRHMEDARIWADWADELQARLTSAKV